MSITLPHTPVGSADGQIEDMSLEQLRQAYAQLQAENTKLVRE